MLNFTQILVIFDTEKIFEILLHGISKTKNLQSFFVREKLTVIYCFHRTDPFYLKHQKIKKF